jgi:hypothetical protein
MKDERKMWKNVNNVEGRKEGRKEGRTEGRTTEN